MTDRDRNQFERMALRIRGTAFFLLVAGLVFSSVYNIWTGHKPITTFCGVVISAISIFAMSALVLRKRKVGRKLDSAPILADANCTLVCLYMSLILLTSSGIYEIFGTPYIDSIGTPRLAYFASTDGTECFEKANSDKYCKCDD